MSDFSSHPMMKNYRLRHFSPFMGSMCPLSDKITKKQKDSKRMRVPGEL